MEFNQTKIMNRNNFDDEEACDNELKSVAFTAASVVVVVISLMIWLIFT
jgi:hypothetical protein